MLCSMRLVPSMNKGRYPSICCQHRLQRIFQSQPHSTGSQAGRSRNIFTNSLHNFKHGSKRICLAVNCLPSTPGPKLRTSKTQGQKGILWFPETLAPSLRIFWTTGKLRFLLETEKKKLLCSAEKPYGSQEIPGIAGPQSHPL